MKQPRIGLVLGGGGAKGAYQLGALLALQKHQLLPHVTAISATSIGAINALLLLGGHLEVAIELWKRLGKEELLPRRHLSHIIKGITNFGIFSRDGLLTLIEKHIDFTRVSESPIKAYVTAVQSGKDHPTSFCLNGVDKNQIIKYVLASSAIPLIYEPVIIDGKKYVDGGKIANEPFAPLLNEELDYIIVIPLNTRYSLPQTKTPIIDLGSTLFGSFGRRAGINFDPQNAQRLMMEGYRQTNHLLDRLRMESVICLTKAELRRRARRQRRQQLSPPSRIYSNN